MNNPTDTPSEQNFERQFPPAAHHAAGQARDDAAATFAHEPGAEPANPDNPRWGIGAALLVWLSSVGLILFGSVLAVIGYAAYRAATGNPITAGSDPTKDPKLLLASVLTTVPAHLLTLVIAWWVATGGGRRSFKEALGLNWTGWPPALLSGGLAVLLYLTALPIASYFGGTETEIDRLIASSTAARIAVAFLAAFSAPIVEEVVYRGLLFPTLQRSLNTTAAIAAVSVLFALVHVPQYWNNVGVIIAITLLSVTLTLVRARTGRLLPCFVIHLVFNGIQSVLILLGASERFAPQPEPPVQEGAVQLLTHLSGLFC